MDDSRQKDRDRGREAWFGERENGERGENEPGRLRGQPEVGNPCRTDCREVACGEGYASVVIGQCALQFVVAGGGRVYWGELTLVTSHRPFWFTTVTVSS